MISPYHIIDDQRIELRFVIIYDFFAKTLNLKKSLSLFDNNEITRSSRVNSGLIMRIFFVLTQNIARSI